MAACQCSVKCNNMPWRQGDKATRQPRGLLYLSPDRMLHFLKENGEKCRQPGSREGCHYISWRRMEHGHGVTGYISQTWTVLSHEPEAMCWPSGDQATVLTQSE